MSDYTSKPKHKFTFGLWTVSNIGRDPFGGSVREQRHLLNWFIVGGGAWMDVVSACKAGVKIPGSTLPDVTQVDVYRRAYPLYQELYPALKSSF